MARQHQHEALAASITQRIHTPRSRGMRWAVAATAGALALIVSSAPGSLALWNGTAAIDDLSVTSGTLSLAIAPGTADPISEQSASLDALSGMLPTESRESTFSVRNTGSTDVELAAALAPATAANGNLVFELQQGTCPAAPAGIPLSGSPTPLGLTLASGAPATQFCLRTTLSGATPDALQGQAVGSYEILLTGAQG